MRMLTLVTLATIGLATAAIAQNGPGAYHGRGSLSVTSSVAINSMTLSTGSALPAQWTNLIAYNPGAVSDIAVCPAGGTCTCPANGVAATNGNTIQKGGGSWSFNFLIVAIATPTVVSCSGSAVIVEFSW